MGLLLFSLAIGVAIGYAWRNYPARIKKANVFTLAGLFVLLLVMGAQLGTNRELFADLTRLGKQALVIAALSIVGSVVMVQLASGFIQKNLKHYQYEQSSKAGDGK